MTLAFFSTPWLIGLISIFLEGGSKDAKSLPRSKHQKYSKWLNSSEDLIFMLFTDHPQYEKNLVPQTVCAKLHHTEISSTVMLHHVQNNCITI